MREQHGDGIFQIIFYVIHLYLALCRVFDYKIQTVSHRQIYTQHHGDGTDGNGYEHGLRQQSHREQHQTQIRTGLSIQTRSLMQTESGSKSAISKSSKLRLPIHSEQHLLSRRPIEHFDAFQLFESLQFESFRARRARQQSETSMTPWRRSKIPSPPPSDNRLHYVKTRHHSNSHNHNQRHYQRRWRRCAIQHRVVLIQEKGWSHRAESCPR